MRATESFVFGTIDRRSAAVVAALVIVATGCHHETATPEELAPPENYIHTIAPADLGVTESALPDRGAVVLNDTLPGGLFPTGIAVFNVSVASQTLEGEDRFLLVDDVPDIRGAFWNDLLGDLDAVREVKLMHTLGIDPRGTGIDALLRSARRMNCKLCFIFAAVEPTDADAEFVGVLWNAEDGTPVAMMRTPVVLEPEMIVACEEHPDAEPLFCYATIQAEGDLRRLLRDVIWDLAGRAAPATTTQPSPWQNDDWLFRLEQRRLEQLKERLYRRQ